MAGRWLAPDGRVVEACSYEDRPARFRVTRRTAERGGGLQFLGYAASAAELAAMGIDLAELEEVADVTPGGGRLNGPPWGIM